MWIGLLLGGMWVAPGARAESDDDVAERLRDLMTKEAELRRQREALDAHGQEPARQRDELQRLELEIAAGEFPGPIRIPGTQQVSLAIGGFIKPVAVADPYLEETLGVEYPYGARERAASRDYRGR